MGCVLWGQLMCLSLSLSLSNILHPPRPSFAQSPEPSMPAESVSREKGGEGECGLQDARESVGEGVASHAGRMRAVGKMVRGRVRGSL